MSSDTNNPGPLTPDPNDPSPFPKNPTEPCHRFKRGLIKAKNDPRTLWLGKYLNRVLLPTPPAAMDWSLERTDWGMMLNDQLGDCTIAGAAHAVQTFTQANGAIVTLPDADVLAYYEKWDGYDPNDPNSDQGGDEHEVLKQWRSQGLSGHTLNAWADVNVKNVNEVKTAIWLFGGLYIGFEVPNNIDETAGAVWDVSGAGPIDGGHCVHVVGYDDKGLILISWGAIYRMTWAFWAKYVSEAHALLSFDWIKNNVAPNQFALADLQADLAQVTR